MTPAELRTVLKDHALWREGNGGKRANLTDANLTRAIMPRANMAGADLTYANMTRANMAGADLTRANMTYANLTRADLTRANMTYANLTDADLTRANMAGADLTRAIMPRANLTGVNLTGANLNGCIGNGREIKSMHLGGWPVTYTADRLQIGCKNYAIDKWREWNTEAGRKWIARMDAGATKWADKYLAHVLATIDLSPATPTGHEQKD